MPLRADLAIGATLILVCGVASGCSSTVDRSAAAQGVESASEATAASPSDSALAVESLSETGQSTGPESSSVPVAPAPPRSAWVAKGHVVKLQLRPATDSSPVKYFEANVAARGQFPEDGRGVELCDVIAADGSIFDCQLNPLKRGNWDIWVRSVNDAGASDWLQGATVTVDSCTSTDGLAGSCEVFDKGPGGGVIVYDAGSRQEWGRFLEVAPAGWSGSSADPKEVWCPQDSAVYEERITGQQATIGSGAPNTAIIIEACGQSTAAGRAAAYRGGGLDDWFLPSSGEIEPLYNMRSEVGGLDLGSYMASSGYWTSSQREKSYATSTDSFAGFPEQAVELSISTSATGAKVPKLKDKWKSDSRSVRPMRAF